MSPPPPNSELHQAHEAGHLLALHRVLQSRSQIAKVTSWAFDSDDGSVEAKDGN